jgi:hypothetical protein
MYSLLYHFVLWFAGLSGFLGFMVVYQLDKHVHRVVGHSVSPLTADNCCSLCSLRDVCVSVDLNGI